MLFEAFCRLARERPDEPAFLVASGDRSLPITWRGFADDVAVIAQGVSDEARFGKIALLGENSYEWIVTHAAVMFSGGTVVPLDINLSAGEIAARLEKVGADALVHSALYAEKAAAVGELLPGLVVGAFGSPESERFQARARARIAAAGKTVFDMPPPDENRTAMIVFTSGTTSEPCGAELTLAGVGAFASFAAGQLELGRGGRSLMLLPLFHIYGICAAYAMLASGVVLGICPDYRRLYDAVVRFKADFLFLVPALADILAAKFEQRIRTTPHSPGTTLKWICSGGAPLSPRTHGRLQALGLEVFSAYGLTETTALYSISRAGGDTPLGSAGAACTLPGVETRVSPEGELMIRGPNVLKGYYGDKERTRKSKTADGWFHTGDLGRIDENGTVWVTGRKTRTIVLSSGKKVAPEEIEAKILLYPGMREAIVRGDGGSRELSAEIYTDLRPEEAHEAVAAMNRTLPIYMRVRKVYIRDTPFPRTASGKILLARPPVPAKRMRPVKKLMIASGVLALTVFVLDMLPYAWYHGNPDSSPLVKRLFRINEITGELLLAAFAVTLLVTGWRLKDIFGDRVSRRRRRKK